MGETMKFALIGCGAIAKKHIESLKRIPEAEIVAVCDVNKDIAESVAKAYDLPYYLDHRRMVADEQIDVLCVLTPSGAHSSVILDLVEFGKHFVVEKPLTLKLSDADEIIEACDRAQSMLFVVQQNRYNPPIQRLKKALVAGRFGKLVMGTVRVRWCRNQGYYDQKQWRGTWAFDGGVLANQANHHIDMLAWLLGDVNSVMAMSSTRLAEIETEDTAVAILKFRSGALGVIEATTATRPKDLEGSISVLGEKGAVEVGGFFMNELKTWNFTEPLPEDENVFEEAGHTPAEFAWSHTEYYRSVMDSIKERKRGLVDGLEGRRSLELINAVYESIETRKEVRLRYIPQFTKLGLES